MTRKKKHVAHANHERWIVSYADFVTLLFAFFVVMFATANADRGKAGIVAAAVRAALNQTKTKAADSAVDPKAMKADAQLARTTAELMPSMQSLQKELKSEIANGNVEMHMTARGLTISLKQASFFDSGSDVVRSSAIPTIAKVGQALLKIRNSVHLEGHTDNVPISTDRFASNWALSSSRAIAVLDLLTVKFRVSKDRLAVAGYADVAPIASNDTEEGRARNRRVDVVILSEAAASSEPHAGE